MLLLGHTAKASQTHCYRKTRGVAKLCTTLLACFQKPECVCTYLCAWRACWRRLLPQRLTCRSWAWSPSGCWEVGPLFPYTHIHNAHTHTSIVTCKKIVILNMSQLTRHLLHHVPVWFPMKKYFSCNFSWGCLSRQDAKQSYTGNQTNHRKGPYINTFKRKGSSMVRSLH